MKRWQRFATGLTAVALAASGGAAWAQDDSPDASPGNTAPPGARAAAAAAPIDTAVESKFTPISPCRIVDTSKAGGKLAASATRSFVAEGVSGFPGQGGKSGGCGIPAAATGIQVVMHSTQAGSRGSLRAYPDNVAAPASTFLHYGNAGAHNFSGSGVITLHTPGTYDFKVSNYFTSTHVQVDVLGYYVKPMWARVNPDATLAEGSRVVAVSKVGGTGWYQVTFDRNVSNCGYSATPYYTFHRLEVQPRNGVPNAVWVATVSTSTGDSVDAAFYLTVTC